MLSNQLHKDPERVFVQLTAESDKPKFSKAGKKSPFVTPVALDPEQHKAAAHFIGPMRVLAPAGSGKTRTLTARIAGLIDRGVAPEKILALAFNKKAALEMKNRLEEMACHGVRSKTLHALGYEIIREAFGWTYSESHQERIFQLIEVALESLVPIPHHPGVQKRVREESFEMVQKAKNELRPFEALNIFDGKQTIPAGKMFNNILKQQHMLGLLTFSDMVYFAVRALVDHPELRQEWQKKFDFVLVDEFQDLNAAQLALIRILCLPHRNIFAVGDDDQLIYAWRGAREQHILDFDQVFSHARSVVLNTNYRSSRQIVRHARWLIEKNPVRVGKDIRPGKDAQPGQVEIKMCETMPEQALAAVKWIREICLKLGLHWDSVGLLCRTNAESKWLEKALTDSGIPFKAAVEPRPEEGDSPPKIERDRATLMTIHKSKGMEFPIVVMFNLSSRGAAQSLTDERRVTYVGVTRAQQALLITGLTDRPSTFIYEFALNPEFQDFAEPYLERKLSSARFRLRFIEWFLSSWRFNLPGFSKNKTGRHVYAQKKMRSQIELLETELHFRNTLNIQFQPHANKSQIDL